MDITDYARVLKRHAILIAVVCLTATAATAILVPELLSETYTATTLVLVRPNEKVDITTEPFSKELLDFPVGGAMPPAEIPSNTYMRIIKSRAVAEKIVRRLRLDESVEARSSEVDSGMVSSIKSGVRELTRATLLVLKYGRVLPPLSAFEQAVEDVQDNISLNAVRDAYQFEISYSYDDPELAAAVANTAANIFLEHMAEINAVGSERTLEYLKGRVEESGGQLAAARAHLRDFKSRFATIDFAEEAAAEIQVITMLETRLEETEIALAGLGERLMPDNPKVQQHLAQKQRIVASLEERRAHINELPSTEGRLAELEMNVQVSDEIYQLINKELETARVRAGNLVQEIEVVSPAVAPIYPTGPIRIKFVGTAFVLSLLVGTGLALFVDYLDTSVRSVESAERALGVQVLATLPKMSRGSGR